MAEKQKRMIGVDFGLVRIGLSISDPTKMIAMPLEILLAEKKSEQTAQKLMRFLDEHQTKHNYEIEKIIIGLPLQMSGKKGFLADEVEHFITLLKKLCTFPITAWDERLTTVQAERSLKEGPFSRKKRAKIVDKISAVILLQSYLDSLPR